MLISYYLGVEKMRAISFAERASAVASLSLVTSLFVISTARPRALYSKSSASTYTREKTLTGWRNLFQDGI